MGVMDQIYDREKKKPGKFAFPEAKNEKIMQAAYETGKEGYIIPILVGNGDEIRAAVKERGYEEDVFTIVDINEEEYKKTLIGKYVSLPHAMLKEKALNRRMQNPLYYAMVMQAVDEADVTFPGCLGSVGTLLAVGDSAVWTNPDVNQLADIAISACDTVKAMLEWEPRCAMVSYSTLGSGQGELVDKVAEAVKLANEKRPDLAIDGEFQFDAAISPAVAEKKVKRESKVAGKANVVIWPDLNVGNVGVKLIQQFGHADAYGPMLQGFNKVVCDCSRGAPVSEIKGNVVISAVRAAGSK